MKSLLVCFLFLLAVILILSRGVNIMSNHTELEIFFSLSKK